MFDVLARALTPRPHPYELLDQSVRHARKDLVWSRCMTPFDVPDVIGLADNGLVSYSQ